MYACMQDIIVQRVAARWACWCLLFRYVQSVFFLCVSVSYLYLRSTDFDLMMSQTRPPLVRAVPTKLAGL